MSVRVTDERHVALYDSVTGVAFGPVFDSSDDAAAFERWTERNGWPDARRAWDAAGDTLAGAWATFLEHHTERECPYDGDDVPEPGWLPAADVSFGDYTEARVSRCGCECHTVQRCDMTDPEHAAVHDEMSRRHAEKVEG